jgi:hypothetical protein
MASELTVPVVIMARGRPGSPWPTICAEVRPRRQADFVILDRGPMPAAPGSIAGRLRLGTAHRVNDLPGMKALGIS